MNINDGVRKIRGRGRGKGRFSRGRSNNVVSIQVGSLSKSNIPPKRKALNNSSSSSNWRTSSTTHNSSTLSVEDDVRMIIALSEGRGEATCEVGIAAINIANPTLTLSQISDSQSYNNTLIKLNVLNPTEILVPITFVDNYSSNRLLEKIKEEFKEIKITGVARNTYNAQTGTEYVTDLCALAYNPIMLVLQHRHYALTAAAALLYYVESSLLIFYANRSIKVEYQEMEGLTMIDVRTADRLELVASTHPNSNAKHSSLFGIMNHCTTRIGARKLRSSILQPPCSVPDIEERLDCISELNSNPDTIPAICGILHKVSNIDQILSLATVIPDEPFDCSERQLNYLLLLNSVLDILEPLKDIIKHTKHVFFREFIETLNAKSFKKIMELLRAVIHKDSHPAKGQNGIIQRCFSIKPGINGMLDLVRKSYSEKIDEQREYVMALSHKYNLDLSLANNNKKGYHLVLNMNAHERRTMKKSDLPKEFIQVDRLTNVFTMKTLDLLNFSARLDDITTQILKMSNSIIHKLLLNILDDVGIFYTLCEQIAKLDMLQSLAVTSCTPYYVKPNFSSYLEVKHSRHPLLDYLCAKDPVANSIVVTNQHNMHIITGPNGSGKSIFIRQILLLQVMAQVGCYVPAVSATFRVSDRIFARIDLGDNMELGASAFVLEIKEIIYFLNVMTKNTFIIIDELCRSTSIEEATALAAAICETLLKTPAFTFVTTHYVYLAKLADMYYNVKAWQLQTSEKEKPSGTKYLEFTYNLVPGVVTLERYALHAARACWPSIVIKYVEDILAELSVNEKPVPEMPKVNPKRQLKYDLEATLALYKSKGELTRQVIAEKLLEYKDNLKKLGHNLNFSDIFEKRGLSEESSEASRNHEEEFIGIGEESRCVGEEARCIAEESSSNQETIRWNENGLRSKEGSNEPHHRPSLNQESLTSSSLLYNEQQASSSISNNGQKMYIQPEAVYSESNTSEILMIDEKDLIRHDRNKMIGERDHKIDVRNHIVDRRFHTIDAKDRMIDGTEHLVDEGDRMTNERYMVTEEESSLTIPYARIQSHGFQQSNNYQNFTFPSSKTTIQSKPTMHNEATIRNETAEENLECLHSYQNLNMTFEDRLKFGGGTFQETKQRSDDLPSFMSRNFDQNNQDEQSNQYRFQFGQCANQISSHHGFSENYGSNQANFNHPTNLFAIQLEDNRHTRSSPHNMFSMDYSSKDIYKNPSGFQITSGPFPKACSSQYQDKDEDNYDRMSGMTSIYKDNNIEMNCLREIPDDYQEHQYSSYKQNENNLNTNMSILIQKNVQPLELEQPLKQIPLKLTPSLEQVQSCKLTQAMEPFLEPCLKAHPNNKETIHLNTSSINTSFSVSERQFVLPLNENLAKTSTPIRQDNVVSKSFFVGTREKKDQVSDLESPQSNFVFRTPKPVKPSKKVVVNLNLTIPESDRIKFIKAHPSTFQSTCQNYSNGVQIKDNEKTSVSNSSSSSFNKQDQQCFSLIKNESSLIKNQSNSSLKTTQTSLENWEEVGDDLNDTVLSEALDELESVSEYFSQNQEWISGVDGNDGTASIVVSQVYNENLAQRDSQEKICGQEEKCSQKENKQDQDSKEVVQSCQDGPNQLASIESTENLKEKQNLYDIVEDVPHECIAYHPCTSGKSRNTMEVNNMEMESDSVMKTNFLVDANIQGNTNFQMENQSQNSISYSPIAMQTEETNLNTSTDIIPCSVGSISSDRTQIIGSNKQIHNKIISTNKQSIEMDEIFLGATQIINVHNVNPTEDETTQLNKNSQFDKNTQGQTGSFEDSILSWTTFPKSNIQTVLTNITGNKKLKLEISPKESSSTKAAFYKDKSFLSESDIFISGSSVQDLEQHPMIPEESTKKNERSKKETAEKTENAKEENVNVSKGNVCKDDATKPGTMEESHLRNSCSSGTPSSPLIPLRRLIAIKEAEEEKREKLHIDGTKAKFQVPYKQYHTKGSLTNFIAPKALTKKQIEECYRQQDQELMNCAEEDMEKNANILLNRPTVKQLKQTEHLAVVRKTNEGVVIYNIKERPSYKKKDKPPLKGSAGSSFNPSIFSDKNVEKFNELLQVPSQKKVEYEEEYSIKSGKAVRKQDVSYSDFSKSGSSKGESSKIRDFKSKAKLNASATSNECLTPDGYNKQNKEKINSIINKYLTHQCSKNSTSQLSHSSYASTSERATQKK